MSPSDKNKRAPSRRNKPAFFFSLWGFLTQTAKTWQLHKRVKKKKEETSDSSDLQPPAASDGTCYSPSPARQSPARAHTSNSHCSPLTAAASFTSPRSALEMRFWDNNGCRGGPGSTVTDCGVEASWRGWTLPSDLATTGARSSPAFPWRSVLPSA